MAITKIQSESLNLADTYAFTGTVTGAGGVNTPMFSAYGSSGTSVSSATETAATLNTEVFDTDNCFNTSNSRFTPTSSGKYLILLRMPIVKAADINRVIGYITKNGSSSGNEIIRMRHDYGNNSEQIYTGYRILSLNGSTDYISCSMYQDSGGSITMYPNLSAMKIIE